MLEENDKWPEFQGQIFYITLPDQVTPLITHLKGQQWIAIDTQVSSAATLRPVVAVLQIAWRKNTAVILTENIIIEL